MMGDGEMWRWKGDKQGVMITMQFPYSPPYISFPLIGMFLSCSFPHLFFLPSVFSAIG